jgi:hypothetical protein
MDALRYRARQMPVVDPETDTVPKYLKLKRFYWGKEWKCCICNKYASEEHLSSSKHVGQLLHWNPADYEDSEDEEPPDEDEDSEDEELKSGCCSCAVLTHTMDPEFRAKDPCKASDKASTASAAMPPRATPPPTRPPTRLPCSMCYKGGKASDKASDGKCNLRHWLPLKAITGSDKASDGKGGNATTGSDKASDKASGGKRGKGDKGNPESIGPSSRAELVAEFQERVAAAKAAAAQAKPVVTLDSVFDEVAGLWAFGSGLKSAFNWSLCVCNNPEHEYQKLRWSTVPNLPYPSCWRAEDRIVVGAAMSTTSSVAASPAGPDSPMLVLATSHSTTKRPAYYSGVQDETKRPCRLF